MEIKLIDGTPYTGTEIQKADVFSYSRKYTNTKWVTTVLPVALDYSDWSSKFEIAEITGVAAQVDGDGNLSSISYQKNILKTGAKTVPNHPYLLRAKTANSTSYQVIKKTNCDVYPAGSDNVEVVSNGYKLTIHGIYGKTDSTDTMFYFSGEIWKQGVTTVNPFRVIIDVEKVNTGGNDTQIDPVPVGDPIVDVHYNDVSGSNSVVVGTLVINGQEIEIKAPAKENTQTSVQYVDLSGSNSVVAGKLIVNGQTIEIKVPVSNNTVVQPVTDTELENRVKRLEDILGSLAFTVVD